ncbi:hypothetical protein ACIFOT_04665 [Neobacillus sp. NRS-1170]|uniref:hypothetical protein n=1 Tax=Neobacillus sp. NRS-1170 TaxID=3233898 RepID=UPI003D28EEDE
MLTNQIEKNLLSVEQLWNQTLQKVEAWEEQETMKEERFLQSAMQFADKLQENNSNIKELTNQFSKKLRGWEKTSKEELERFTTPLLSVFPTNSFEEMNNKLDQLWSNTTETSAIPYEKLINGEIGENFVASLEKYIEFRRNNRNMFMKTIKETAAMFQTNQLAFLKAVTSQVENVFFPFNKFIERTMGISNSQF